MVSLLLPHPAVNAKKASMQLTQRQKHGSFYFVVRQQQAEVPGAGAQISVYAAYEGEGVPVIERTLYFEEAQQSHVDNFCHKFAHDPHYREICLLGTAHWRRVAGIYEHNARVRTREGGAAKDSENACRELFHCIRRDLLRIERHPSYRAEMARLAKGRESALEEALRLLDAVPGVKVAAACQGSATIMVCARRIYLPSCHAAHAFVSFTALPAPFLHYLHSGPLGKDRLAVFAPDRITSARVVRNKAFIRTLTDVCRSYLHKIGSPAKAGARRRQHPTHAVGSQGKEI